MKGPPGPARAPLLHLRDLLFLPAGTSKPDFPAAQARARVMLNNALSRDLATYGGADWKVRHALEV
jgi:hypothetical protein